VRRRTITALLLLPAAGLAFGCGSDEDNGRPIPRSAAAELEKRLDSVQARFEFGGGACGDIPEDEQLADQTIAGLPDDVDPDVRRALQDGFDRLFRLTDEQCDEQQGQDTDTTETEPPPTDTDTTQPEPPITVPEPDQPVDPVTPEDPEGGDGGGAISPEEDE
jgi:hypothetical protein